MINCTIEIKTKSTSGLWYSYMNVPMEESLALIVSEILAGNTNVLGIRIIKWKIETVAIDHIIIKDSEVKD